MKNKELEYQLSELRAKITIINTDRIINILQTNRITSQFEDRIKILEKKCKIKRKTKNNE